MAHGSDHFLYEQAANKPLLREPTGVRKKVRKALGESRFHGMNA
jgi:hypothetical protein